MTSYECDEHAVRPGLGDRFGLAGLRVVDQTVIPPAGALAVQWEQWVLTSVSRDSFHANHQSCSKKCPYLEPRYGIEP